MESKTIVYILRSERNPARRYTGITSDIARRLQWHNTGQNVSTFDDRPWSVHVAFHFSNEARARRFERYLKTGSGREFARRHFDDIPDT
jgi:putative endonuclease